MTKKKTDIPLFPGENSSHRRTKLGDLLHSSEPAISLTSDPPQHHFSTRPHDRHSNVVSYIPSPVRSPNSSNSSPANNHFFMSPFYQTSPFSKSPWNFSFFNTHNTNGLIGSLVREEGHVYSLASSGDLLYTGSDSKNIRVWKNLTEFSGFKSTSGLVKAIVVSGDNRIFTGHQDGKIRVWKYYPDSRKSRKAHKRVGSLPTTRDFIISSMNPANYVEVRRHRNVPWIKHFDVVSCMSLDEEHGLLYSGSWDKTLKVWRLSDSKCLESVNAHDDAVNSVVAGFEGLVLTGSADGSVKVWRRELVGKETKHMMVYVLINQEAAITSVTVNKMTGLLSGSVIKTLTNNVHDSYDNYNNYDCHGAVVYAGSSDGLVNFWERRKHMLVHGGVIRGHRQAVLCLASAGPLLFSGSADKSICVWRREVGGFHTCLSVLTGHDGPIKCLTVEEQGEGGDGDREWVVYSGSLDKSVKLWRLSEQAWR